MAEHEESEITAEFGNILRTALGGSLQLREAQARRQQMAATERAAEADRQTRTEAALASTVSRELHNREFWRVAGSESIADHVTVAAHLSGTYPEARTAWMHAADLLRNDYGINLELINRDHPTALHDRHAALRDALDDYFARQRLDADHDQHLSPTTEQQAGYDQEPGETPDQEPEQDTEAAETTTEPADQQPPVVDGQTAEQREETSVSEEAADLARAKTHSAETHQDRMNAITEEQTGGRQPYNYQRITDTQLTQIERAASNPELAAVRARQGATFGRSTAERVASGSSRLVRSRTDTRAGQDRTQEAGVSR